MAYGLLSPGNSSTTPLAGGATFEGAFEEIIGYGMVAVLVKSDVASANDGVRFIWSNNGTDEHFTRDVYTYSASDPGRIFVTPAVGSYFKLRYINGVAPLM